MRYNQICGLDGILVAEVWKMNQKKTRINIGILMRQKNKRATADDLARHSRPVGHKQFHRTPGIVTLRP